MEWRYIPYMTENSFNCHKDPQCSHRTIDEQSVTFIFRVPNGNHEVKNTIIELKSSLEGQNHRLNKKSKGL